ncbi:tannase/feruloyl esterase family alpha/beta hydrolase [Shewanella sp.]|uniref:tannase/feruloyl esterase family alpha/beta hydrolase n=1 Tax=Shewanella sp. TaxID=50422 RepID=UPI003A8C1CCD
MEKRPQLVPTIALSCLLLGACGDNDSTPLTQHLSPATPATLNICSDIASQFNFENTVITSSEMVSAGKVEYSATESYSAPEHCVVKGYMNERMGLGSSGEADTKYAIGFEMRLPTDWNGRFYYQANGGLDGSVSKAVGRLIFAGGTDSAALNRGFAVISSDAGHPSPAPQFGFDPQARIDYGYNAVAELTPMAKSLIKIAYGKQPDRSYFAGCSNGGRHTMVAASRYADMYDGFIVGNPGLHLPNAAVSQLYGVQQYSKLVTYNPDGSDILATLQTAITQEEFGVVSQQILKQCDTLDGLADGMINNTYACQKAFDLDRDVPTCSGERDGTCLSAEQKQALSNIMAGPHNSQTGESLYANFPYDAGISAKDWSYWEYYMALNRDTGSVGYVFSTPPTPFDNNEQAALAFIQSTSVETYAQRIHNTTSLYTESGYDFMTPPELTKLSTLRARGAKMMVFHGTSDAVFSTNDTVNWYKELDSNNSGKAADFAKLYLIPGMGHCGKGPTTDKFNMVDALVNWVEKGVTPSEILASVRAENTELPADWSKTRTRPLCPFPKMAKYNGSGDIEDAANFSCVASE